MDNFKSDFSMLAQKETVGKAKQSSSAPKSDAQDLPTVNLPGFVEKVVYKSQDSDFAILYISISDRSKYFDPATYPQVWLDKMGVSIKVDHYSMLGENFSLKQFVFCGKIVDTPKYGPQLHASYQFADMPYDKKGMIAYLDSLPNVGEGRARKLVSIFGVDGIVDVMENAPSKLVEAKIGLTQERVDVIVQRWMEDRVIRKTFMWLGSRGLTNTMIAKIVQKWKGDTIAVIEQNPYVLTEIYGVGFKKADDIAFKIMGDNVPVDIRTLACLTYLLEEAIQKDGHVALPVPTLEEKAMDLLQRGQGAKVLPEVYLSNIRSMLLNQEKKFCLVDDGENTLVYSPATWIQEKKIAEMIVKLAKSPHGVEIQSGGIELAHEDLKDFYEKDVVLDENQIKAVMSSFQNRITVITGGAGTGKSTICRCVCTIAKANNLSVRLMTPTGKASRVLSEKTGVSAGTIHRSLKMGPGSIEPNAFVHEDLLIVDETSMCGIDTMYAVLSSLQQNPNINLVLVGDHRQLPSVSPGNILFDVIQSGCANVVHLNQIYRQDEYSFITWVADKVAKGEDAVIPSHAKDISVKECDPEQVPEVICRMIGAYIEHKHNLDDIQVLAPMYRGLSGVDNLNKTLQHMIAEKRGISKCMDIGHSKIFMKDRVMQLENNYNNEVFNGDVGVAIDMGKTVLNPELSDEKVDFIDVDFGEGHFVRYGRADFSQIRPAWCVTIHKFQGSQCQNVIFVASKDHYIMMARELVYTGITRAQKKVVIVGSKRMLRVATEKSVSKKRYTSLSKMIRQGLTGEKLLRYYHCPMEGQGFSPQIVV